MIATMWLCFICQHESRLCGMPERMSCAHCGSLQVYPFPALSRSARIEWVCARHARGLLSTAEALRILNEPLQKPKRTTWALVNANCSAVSGYSREAAEAQATRLNKEGAQGSPYYAVNLERSTTQIVWAARCDCCPEVVHALESDAQTWLATAVRIGVHLHPRLAKLTRVRRG